MIKARIAAVTRRPGPGGRPRSPVHWSAQHGGIRALARAAPPVTDGSRRRRVRKRRLTTTPGTPSRPLDLLYFAGYAMWTYLCVPFVFTDPAYELHPAGTWQEGGDTWRKLHVRFPSGIHTHSRDQVLYADQRGRIRRHDYTAEPFGAWARAAHYSTGHQDFNGLVVPTRRRVHPRRADGSPRPHPTLVWINVEDVAVAAGNHCLLAESGRRPLVSIYACGPARMCRRRRPDQVLPADVSGTDGRLTLTCRQGVSWVHD